LVVKSYLKWTAGALLLVLLGWVYKSYNPLDYAWFPKCPFRTLTGLLCPGCGAQRAVHDLLNLDILSALKENALLVLAFPYLLVALVFKLASPLSGSMLKWRKMLFGAGAIKFILVLVMAFWIGRNVL